MQHVMSLAAIGVLSAALMAAVVSEQAQPSELHNQPLWPSDVSLMLSLPHAQAKMPPPARVHFHGAHEHRSPGKPAADVQLVSPGVQTLNLAEEQNVALELHSHLHGGQLRVVLETSPELYLTGASSEWLFELHGAETFSLPVTLTAQREGQHYVHLFIEHVAEDGTRNSRALATEFRVNMPTLHKAFAKTFQVGDAERVIQLPAAETIF